MAYNAGRVFLQVVPSYNSFMRQVRKDVNGPLGKALTDALSKPMDDAGVKSGERFAENLRKGVDNASDKDFVTTKLMKGLDKAMAESGRHVDDYRDRMIALKSDIRDSGRATDQHIRASEGLALAMAKDARATDDLSRRTNLHNAANQISSSTVQRYTREVEKASTSNRELSKTHRDVDRDSNLASRGINRLRDSIMGVRGDSNDGANAFRFFNGILLAALTIGPALIPVLAAIAGGLALAGVAALGAASGIGVAVLAFSGIGGAVKALGAQQDASNKSSIAYGRAVSNAARAVADARRGLGDAYRSSAEGIRNAIESQRRAEQSLTEAQRDAKKAQQELTEARKQAKQELADLDDKVAQNALDERQGVIDLFNAYNKYGAVQSDGGSTNLEKEQSDIGLKQAELNLKRIRTEQKKLADEKKKADKGGINGTDTVQRAEDNLTKALQRQKEARLALGKAARNVDKARVDGARSVADAQRTLNRSQEDYQYALQGGAEAADKLQKAMDKLSPAGQRFARFIFSLRDGLGRLREIAQEGMLPGVQAAIERIIGVYSPGMTKFVEKTSKLLGGLSIEIGKTFTNKAWRRFFSDMSESSGHFITEFTRAFLGFSTGLAGFFDAMIPYAERFATGLANIGDRFAKWSNSDKGRASIRRFFDYVEKIGPKVLDFFGGLVGALVSLGVAIAPIGESVMGYLTDLFRWISKLDPKALGLLAAGFASIIVALQASSGIVAFISLVGIISGSPVLVAVASIIGLAAAFYYLGGASGETGKEFRKFIDKLRPLLKIGKQIWTMLKEQLVKTFNEAVIPAVRAVANVITEDLLPSLERFWPVIKPLVGLLFKLFGATLRGLITAVKDVIVGVVKVFSGLLDVITGIFTGDWGLVKSGLKKVFLGIFQAIWGLINVYFFGKILGIFRSFGAGLIGFFKKGLGKGIVKVFKSIFEGLLYIVKQPLKFIRALIGLWVHLIVGYFKLWRTGIKFAIDVILKVLRFLGRGVVSLGKGIIDFVKGTGGRFASFGRGVKKVFTSIGKAVLDFLNRPISAVRRGLKRFVDVTLAAFYLLRDKMKKIFSAIGGFVGKNFGNPILTVVDKVVNGALIGGINRIAGFVGLGGKDKKVLGDIPLPKKFARGGISGVMPGYTPGRDNALIAVGGGEAIMRPEVTRGLGVGSINALNAAAIRGGVGAVKKILGFARGGVAWPANTRALSGDYPGHTGVDIRAGMGSPVFAAHAGKVTATPRWNYSYGNHVRIKGTDGFETIYGHLSKILARVGEAVKAGTRIGNAGSTGNSSGPHLHFEVRPGGTRAAALAYLRGSKNIKGKGGKGGKLSALESLGKGALGIIRDPIGFLGGRIDKAFAAIGGKGGPAGDMLKMAKKLPQHFMSEIGDFFKKKIMNVFGVGKKFFHGIGNKVASGAQAIGRFLNPIGGAAPRLYDNGGFIPPGVSTIVNKTGRPERVLTDKQWAILQSSRPSAGGDTYNLTAHGSDAKSAARQLASDLQHERRRQRRSGTLAKKVA